MVPRFRFGLVATPADVNGGLGGTARLLVAEGATTDGVAGNEAGGTGAVGAAGAGTLSVH
ncbi:MAG TPA: hypothetical protein VGK17_22525 [Propionicimonas sp.]